jgi:hypothetical protein
MGVGAEDSRRLTEGGSAQLDATDTEMVEVLCLKT